MQLEQRIFEELQATQEQLDKTSELLSNAQLDSAYRAFRARFSPERLAALDGEELLFTMHYRGANESLAYWLEFKNDAEFPTPRFGSIAGGSALKFGIFYRQDQEAWITGSAVKQYEVSLSEAIAIARKQRDEFIAGAELLASFPLHGSDEDYLSLQEQMRILAPTVGESAWGHKYFSLLFPDKLDDFHNPNLQRFHLIRLLQSPPPGEGRYICGGRFVALAAELDARIPQATGIINRRNGSPYHYWRVGTTEGDSGQSHWEGMKQGGYIGIGWDGIGNLTAIQNNPNNSARKTAIKQLLMQYRPEKYPTEGAAGNAAGEIHRFLMDIRTNDLILASQGGTVLGIGRVQGPYYFAAEGRFRHRLPVEWLSLETWRMPHPEHIRSTTNQLKYPDNLVEAEKRILDAPDVPIIAPVPQSGSSAVSLPTPPLQGIPAQIAHVLERKGQVILYGPPGTGKTYWAEIAAHELAARSWFQKTYSYLSDEERAKIQGTEQQPGIAVRMCSFHPAYGYEDFLEGYRPEAVNGQMAFQLRNGIFKRLCEDAAAQPDRLFFLIIDEINRGDIPRIFGELLTVMEQNKRGKPILLPLTGTPFRVPPNVHIIGTMNTADRSIALLDAALRRRFGFVELMPDSSVLGQKNIGALPLRQWFETLNASIVQHVGRDGRNLQIGHSYLLTATGTPLAQVSDFTRVLAEDIIPLLQEYCYEDYTTLDRILGSSLIDVGKQRIRTELFAAGREDDLIGAILAHHPDLSAYTLIPEAGEEMFTSEDAETDEGSSDAESLSTPDLDSGSLA